MKNLFLFIFILAALSSCNPSGKRGMNFGHIPLEDFQYEEAEIKPGTEVKLLAFSGGDYSDDNDIHYYQFLVLIKGTHDTIRILAPLIFYEDPDISNKKMAENPLKFDAEKGITDATYSPMDTIINLLLQPDALSDAARDGETTDIKPLMKKIDKKQMVVLNKDMPEFMSSYFKAVTGVLNFKEMPW